MPGKKEPFDLDAFLEAADPATPLPIGKRVQTVREAPYLNLGYLAGQLGARVRPGLPGRGDSFEFACLICGGLAVVAEGWEGKAPFRLSCAGHHAPGALRAALVAAVPAAFEVRDDIIYPFLDEQAEQVVSYAIDGLGRIGDRDITSAIRSFTHSNVGVRAYRYTGPNGATLMIVLRRDLAEGKRFLPIRQYVGGTSVAFLEPKFLPGLLPPYNWAEIEARADATVLVVEGEQTADAARNRFPDLVVTTSACGALNAAKTDWSPLSGRDIIIWRDNDDSGLTYQRSVAAHCKRASIFSLWQHNQMVKPLTMVFAPGRPVEPDEFNTFRGFDVKPTPGGSYALFREHVDRIMAASRAPRRAALPGQGRTHPA